MTKLLTIPKFAQETGLSYRLCLHIRHGTLSLLAGIDLLSGEVLGLVRERHRSVEFIEFLTADGSNNQQISAALRVPPVTVGKWRQAFAAQGIEGLRDAPRSGRPPKYNADVRHQVQTRVCQQPDDQSRWTVRTLAAELQLPASTVHAMLVAAKLQPHRIRTFTFSPDPDFEAKLLDIVGLYLNPPENALVLCVDEKPSIQALDRTQPLLPLRAKKPRTWVRHGTQTSSARPLR